MSDNNTSTEKEEKETSDGDLVNVTVKVRR